MTGAVIVEEKRAAPDNVKNPMRYCRSPGLGAKPVCNSTSQQILKPFVNVECDGSIWPKKKKKKAFYAVFYELSAEKMTRS